MKEALTPAQLSFLRRAAAAGHVSVVSAEETAIIGNLIAKRLIMGNQLTDAGWRELRKARGPSAEGLIPFAPSQDRDDLAGRTQKPKRR